MRFENTRNLIFQDIHIFNIILVSVLSFLQFTFIGKVIGLTSYGIMLAYSVVFFFYNLRIKRFYTPWILYVIVLFYLYFLIATCANGSVMMFGSSLLQLLFICLISFFDRNTTSYVKDFISISKVLIILSLFMGCGSVIIGLIVYLYPEMISSLPMGISEYLKSVAGSFPVRLTGLAWHPNSSAKLCLIGSMFSIYLLTCEEIQSVKWKILAIINTFFSLYFIGIATNSRTSLIVLFSFCFIYGFIYAFKIKKGNKAVLKTIIYIVIVLFAILILFLVLISVSTEFKNYLLNDILRISTISTATGRTTIYKIAFELGENDRLFGFHPDRLDERVHVASTHNLFLELLSFGGVPSLVLYAIFFFYTLYVSWKNLTLKTLMEKQQVLCAFLFCYIVCYFIYGIAERASVNGVGEIAVLAQIVFGITHVINHNEAGLSKQEVIE